MGIRAGKPRDCYASKIAIGQVFHCRYAPTHHQFQYPLMMMWIDLDEVSALSMRGWSKPLWGFGSSIFSCFRFDRKNYLKDECGSNLKQAVLNKVRELSGTSLSAEKVFFLGQLRYFGVYFSPLNLYFIEDKARGWQYTLAEVSNTPWNEQHYYLLPVLPIVQHQKTFHVSPFHSMDQQYHWRIYREAARCSVQLQNWVTEHRSPIFEARFELTLKPWCNRVWWQWAGLFPFITLRILCRIYWQALKLWWKKVPFCPHPNAFKKDDDK